MQEFSLFYHPPIKWFLHYLSKKSAHPLININEHYVKQTFFNRTLILTSQGIQKLIIPIFKPQPKTCVKDIKICNDNKWQKNHWHALRTAYNNSPYFQYFSDYFEPFYVEKKYHYLIDFTTQLLLTSFELFNLDKPIIIGSAFSPNKLIHYSAVHVEKKITYGNVFGIHIDVIHEDISILDYLFCNGNSHLLIHSY